MLKFINLKFLNLGTNTSVPNYLQSITKNLENQ